MSEKRKVGKEDYLELWKYFEDRAIGVKGAMFSTLTWNVGFAAALIAFIFTMLTKGEAQDPMLPIEWVTFASSIAGLFICWYAIYGINESEKHIRNNWKYSKNCRREIEGLNKILELKENPGDENEEEVEKDIGLCVRLKKIVYAYMAIFGLVLVWLLISKDMLQ